MGGFTPEMNILAGAHFCSPRPCYCSWQYGNKPTLRVGVLFYATHFSTPDVSLSFPVSVYHQCSIEGLASASITYKLTTEVEILSLHFQNYLIIKIQISQCTNRQYTILYTCILKLSIFSYTFQYLNVLTTRVLSKSNSINRTTKN